MLKTAYETAGFDVILADSGDCIQGSIVGTLSKGEYIIDIMNELGYDVMTIGNHEFDYGYENLVKLMDKADFPIVSCNIFYNSTDTLFTNPYAIIECCNTKIAFIGITTPITTITTAKKNITDETGEYVFDFGQDETNDRLVSIIQKNVDDAREYGADYVFALSHLGTKIGNAPYRTTDIASKISGINAYLDGDSHVVENEIIKDKDNKNVILTQTGSELENIGVLIIHKDGSMNNKLVNSNDIDNTLNDIKESTSEMENTIVAHTDYTLCIYDPNNFNEDGSKIRIVRKQETNLADLCADAIKYAGDTEIGLINSGGIRSDIEKGDITYGDIIKVHPFGSNLSTCMMTGKTLKDALEFGAKDVPNEFAGLLQVSGVTYEIDTSINSNVVINESKEFVSVNGEYRVKNIKINGEDLDENRYYSCCCDPYILEGGDGFTMFENNVEIIQSRFTIDYQELINYIQNVLNCVISEEYSNPYGNERIIIK